MTLAQKLNQARSELTDLIIAANQRIAQLEAEVAVLKGDDINDRADIFWDAEDPDVPYGFPGEIAGLHDLLEITEVQRAVRLTSVYVVRIPIGDGDDDVEVFSDRETAEAYVRDMTAPETDPPAAEE